MGIDMASNNYRFRHRRLRVSWMFDTNYFYPAFHVLLKGGQWLSGRVLDSRPKGREFEPRRHHCIVVLEQDTFILA